MLNPLRPIDVAPLFPGLHAELMTLLRGLRADDWLEPTWAPQWRVRDVVAHLLDGELRRLSIQRDGVAVTPAATPITVYASLLATWTT